MLPRRATGACTADTDGSWRRLGDPDGTRDFADLLPEPGGVLLRRCWDAGARLWGMETGGVWLRTDGRIRTVVLVTGGVLLRPAAPGGVRLRAELVTGGVRLREPAAGGVKLRAVPLLASDALIDLLDDSTVFSSSRVAAFRRSTSDFRPISSWCSFYKVHKTSSVAEEKLHNASK